MDNKQIISNLIISYSGQKRTINIPVLYLELLEDYNTAVILNQLIYWSDRSSRTDGYFFKSYKEWAEEVFLSQYQVKKSIDKLKKLGLVETKLKKSYGSPTLHYKVDMEEISKWIIKKLDNRISRNLINDYQETSYSLTKNTTENTTENTTQHTENNLNTDNSKPKDKKINDKDPVTKSLSLIQEKYFSQISPIKLESMVTEIEKLGDNAFEIISIAVDYTTSNNKNLNYLTKVINNWADDNVTTVEQAKEKVNGKPKRANNDWIEDALKELGNNE